jgi:indole-3-glycerol phosphate synthase
MNGFLTRVIEEKKAEVFKLKDHERGLFGDEPPYPIRDFEAAISKHSGIDLIAEIKLRSPSSGPIREDVDVMDIARIYERCGASSISLITDKIHFGGDIAHLPELKEGVGLPLLRKDFIIDERQVMESFHWGADAILLIAKILPDEQLDDLLAVSRDLGMTALVEIHDEEDLDKALHCGATVIGINNRNLDSLEVDLKTTKRLAPKVPQHCITISESGIGGGKDILALQNGGIQGVLVGTAIMKSRNISGKVKELVGAGRFDPKRNRA